MGNPPEVKDTTLIIVLKDGRVRAWEDLGWVDIDAPFRALGTGSQIALGAMAAGASAIEAVTIASNFDAYTGGDISVFSLEAAEESPPIEGEIEDFFPAIEPTQPVAEEPWREAMGLK